MHFHHLTHRKGLQIYSQFQTHTDTHKISIPQHWNLYGEEESIKSQYGAIKNYDVRDGKCTPIKVGGKKATTTTF